MSDDPFFDPEPDDGDVAAPKKAGRWEQSNAALDEAVARARDGLPTWDGSSPVREVTLRHVPDHGYRKVKGGRGCKLIVNGVPCRKAEAAVVHYLPTMNQTLTQDWKVYQGARKHWLPFLVDQVAETGLPLGLSSVAVMARFCFPDRRTDRDKGNFRGFIEKVLGDALEAGGWIKRDNWDTYDFISVSATRRPKERWTELLLMPNVPMGELGAEEPAELTLGL